VHGCVRLLRGSAAPHSTPQTLLLQRCGAERLPLPGAMRRAAAAVVNHDTVQQATQAAAAVPIVPPVDPGLSAHIATVLDAAHHAAQQVRSRPPSSLTSPSCSSCSTADAQARVSPTVVTAFKSCTHKVQVVPRVERAT